MLGMLDIATQNVEEENELTPEEKLCEKHMEVAAMATEQLQKLVTHENVQVYIFNVNNTSCQDINTTLYYYRTLPMECLEYWSLQ